MDPNASGRKADHLRIAAEPGIEHTGGSGLGLPIARDIAQAHDGTLRVVATATGARLRAVLPLLSDPAHT